MSKFVTFLPSRLSQITAALPKRCNVVSTTLINDGKRCGIELVWDNPDQKTGFTFPVEVSYEQFQQDLKGAAEAAEMAARLRVAAEAKRIEDARIEAERIEKETLEQLTREQASDEPCAPSAATIEAAQAMAAAAPEENASKPVGKKKKGRQS